MINKILCKIGIHNLTKWVHKEIFMKEYWIGFIITFILIYLHIPKIDIGIIMCAILWPITLICVTYMYILKLFKNIWRK